MLQLVCALCGQLVPSASAVPSPQLTIAPSAWLQAAAVPQRAKLVPFPAAPPSTGSLSTTIALSRARQLTLSATPSPARCAPLLELDF
jgi:hypothetical protein